MAKCDQDFIKKCKARYQDKAYTYFNETDGNCKCGQRVEVDGEERIIGPGGIRVGASKKKK